MFVDMGTASEPSICRYIVGCRGALQLGGSIWGVPTKGLRPIKTLKIPKPSCLQRQFYDI